MHYKNIQAVLTVSASAFAVCLGDLAAPCGVLVIMMLIDYSTGIAAAYITKSLSSRIGITGIIKKVGCIALVAVAVGADYLIYSGLASVSTGMEPGTWFGVLVAVWLTINEMISILENLKKIGVPIPGFLTGLVESLRNAAEDKKYKHLT